MENYQCKTFNNFRELFETDEQLARALLHRLGYCLGADEQPEVEEPWMSRELIVYPTEYDFGLYQLQDGLYKVFGFEDNDYYPLRDPFDFIDMNLFGERLAEDFDNTGNICLYTGDCVIESPYGFR